MMYCCLLIFVWLAKLSVGLLLLAHVPRVQQLVRTAYLRYVDICNRLDTIAAQIESARSESRFESQSIQILQDELSRISKEICSNGLRDKDNLYNMMQIHREIQGKKAKKKNDTTRSTESSSASGSTVSGKAVLGAMQSIYALARCWCQRVTCQGFNMQRLSSTWSEISNNSIKAFIKHSKVMSGDYTLSSFVMDVDRWVHKQCELAFQDNKVKFNLKSDALRDDQLTILQQVLCNGAVSNLLRNVIPRTLKNEYIVDSDTVQLKFCCRTVQDRVQEYIDLYDIQASEVTLFKARSSEPTFSPVAAQLGKAGSAVEIDLVHATLLEVTDLANTDSSEHVVAVYFPTGGDCKIRFFNESRPLGHGVPFFCTCMKHSASGLPCEHQMSWILRNRKGSIWPIIYLCHPAFIRGHQVS